MIFVAVQYKQARYRWINPSTLEESSSQESNEKEPILDIDYRKDSSKKIIKAGIQAPPGTTFLITIAGESKPVEYMIGKTGLLELDYENLIIVRIQLVLKNKYEFNKEATEAALIGGLTKMNEAIEKYLINGEIAKESEHEVFLNDYMIGYKEYRRGVKGIYQRKEYEFEEVSNVLVDYILEVN